MALSEDQSLKLAMAIEGSKERYEELSEWEQGFIASTEERHTQYGDDIRVSDKQWAVIDRIYEKVVPR